MAPASKRFLESSRSFRKCHARHANPGSFRFIQAFSEDREIDALQTGGIYHVNDVVLKLSDPDERVDLLVGAL